MFSRKCASRWADILLSVDANSAYTLDEAEHLRKFDAFKLLMIEQPLWDDEIYLHARLQKAIETAICLDESIHHARDANFAIETGACRIVNIKVGRVGRIHGSEENSRRRAKPRRAGVVRRDAGIGRGARAQHRAFDAGRISFAGRRFRVEALLEAGHH